MLQLDSSLRGLAMSSEWIECTLGDVLTLQRGMDLPSQLRAGGEVPIYASTGVVGFHNHAPVKAPGVVIGRSGSIGGGQYITKNFWPLNTTLWVKDFKGNNPRYCYYLLRSIDFTLMNAGSGVPTLNRNHLHPMKIKFPIRVIQDQISETLGVLDDKVSLLTETNKTLESMAQAIFHSWFMNFDPVHAKQQGKNCVGMDAETAALFPDAFEVSELGDIPKGWSIVSLKDVVSIYDTRRIPLSSEERRDIKGVYPYYGAASMMDRIDKYIFDGIYLLLGEDGTVVDEDNHPVLQYVWDKFWVNNHAHVLQGNNGISTEHLMLFLQGVNMQPYITGAVQLKISQGSLWRIKFIKPPENISNAFNSLIDPFFKKIRSNHNQIVSLINLRDTILPRLISGQLSIDDSEQFILEDC